MDILFVWTCGDANLGEIEYNSNNLCVPIHIPKVRFVLPLGDSETEELCSPASFPLLSQEHNKIIFYYACPSKSFRLSDSAKDRFFITLEYDLFFLYFTTLSTWLVNDVSQYIVKKIWNLYLYKSRIQMKYWFYGEEKRIAMGIYYNMYKRFTDWDSRYNKITFRNLFL